MATYHEKRSSAGEERVRSVILHDEHAVVRVRRRTLNMQVRARTTNLLVRCRLQPGEVSIVVECQCQATTAVCISGV